MFANLREKFNEKIKTLSVAQDPMDRRINELVDRATSDVLISPDWGVNMELVDVINTQPSVTLDKSTRALKRSLSSTNSKVQLLTLTVLETCIKNCNRSFHRHLVHSEVFTEMLRIAGSSVGPPVNSEVKDRVLCLIEDLSKALDGPYRDAYESLLDKGVDFPVRAPEDVVPLEIPADTPEPSNALSEYSEEDRAAIQKAMAELAAEARQDQQQQQPQQQEQQSQQPPAPGPQSPSALAPQQARPASPQHAARPQSPAVPHTSPDEVLQAATVSQEVLAEALAGIPEAQPEGVREQYIAEVAAQCRAQRSQLAQVIETCTDEALLVQALSLHEVLQATIEKYNGLVVRASAGTGLPQSTAAAVMEPVATPTTATSTNAAAPFAGPQFTISEDDDVADEGLVTRRQALPSNPVPVLPPPPATIPAPAPAADLIDLDSDHGSPTKQAAAGARPVSQTGQQMLEELDRLVLNNPSKQ